MKHLISHLWWIKYSNCTKALVGSETPTRSLCVNLNFLLTCDDTAIRLVSSIQHPSYTWASLAFINWVQFVISFELEISLSWIIDYWLSQKKSWVEVEFLFEAWLIDFRVWAKSSILSWVERIESKVVSSSMTVMLFRYFMITFCTKNLTKRNLTRTIRVQHITYWFRFTRLDIILYGPKWK